MDEAEPKPQASTKNMMPPLGTTEGRGTHYHGYPAHPAKMTNLAASPFSTSQAQSSDSEVQMVAAMGLLPNHLPDGELTANKPCSYNTSPTHPGTLINIRPKLGNRVVADMKIPEKNPGGIMKKTKRS